MSEQYCAEHDFYYSPNHIIDVVCPWCEIDRLNKEINRLRQYEDAITSTIDGTLLVWNLMSTNHTVIKNDYWQNHLEEIDRLKAELEEERSSWSLKAVEQFNRADDLERQLAEARAEIERLSSPDYYACAMCPDIKEARQEAARTVERHLLGMFWCIPSKENEPMIYRDQAIEWLRGAFGLEG